MNALHRQFSRPLIISSSILSLCIAAASHGQERSSTTLEEIVVTATKRSTSLQKTPLAISAMSERSMALRGIDDLTDLVTSVPGLTLRDGGPGQTRPIIRGIFGPGEPQVGVYFDETPFSGAPGTTNNAGRFSPELKPFDVQRVEVLKGPQGTLYGGGSMGGTIRYLLNKPDTKEYSAKIATEGSTVENGSAGYQINGALNLPLVTDQVALRLVGYKRDDGGFIDNVTLGKDDINDVVTEGGRVMLRWLATDTLTVDAAFHQQEQVVGGGFHINTDLGDDDPQTHIGANEPFEDDISLATLTLENSFEHFDALYSFSRFERDAVFNLFNDFPEGFPFPKLLQKQPQDLSTDTHELRFTSSSSGNIDWVVGFFSQSRESGIETRISSPDANGNEPGNVTNDPNDPNGELFFFNRTVDATLDQDSIYGELAYHFTERFTGTIGARWFDIANSSTVTNIVAIPATPIDDILAQTTNGDESGTTFKLHVAYDLSDDILLYSQWAQGYRPGAANQNSSNIAIDDPSLGEVPESFESDSVDSYEIGMNSTWLEKRLTLNGAIYHMQWDDIQVESRGPSGLFTYMTNGDGAEVTGVELETAYQVTDNLVLSSSVSYTQAELTGATPFNRSSTLPDGSRGSNSGLDGDSIPNVPELTFNASLEYAHDLSDGLNALFFIDYAYVDESATAYSEFLVDSEFNRTDTPNPTYSDVQGGYGIVDVRLGLEADAWSAFLYADNLFDKRGISQVRVDGTFVAPPGYSTIERPRTLGFRFNYNF